MSTSTPRVTLSLLHLGIDVTDNWHHIPTLAFAIVHVPLLGLLGLLLLHHDVVVLWGSLIHIHHFILLKMEVVRAFNMFGSLRMIILMNSIV